MAKKLGKILLFTAAAGSAAAAACYFMQKKAATKTASEDEDYDDFTEEEGPQSSHTYVPLTPEAKNGDEKAEASDAEDKAAEASDAEDNTAEASDINETDAEGTQGQNTGFTPLSEQLSQTAGTEEETVEEFFNEDTEDTAAPEKAE